MLGVLTRIVEDADRLAGGLSCRLQLFLQALELGLHRKILSHHRYELAVPVAGFHDSSSLNSSLRELIDKNGKIGIEFLRKRQKQVGTQAASYHNDADRKQGRAASMII
ncbi:hypothetical protein BMJ22_15240 [Sinorhizobium medicae]|nr:hypothetical protein BMJ22_15240 [Sinorhizobium medicae]